MRAKALRPKITRWRSAGSAIAMPKTIRRFFALQMPRVANNLGVPVAHRFQKATDGSL
jgi:hypothetical protein